MDGNGELNGYRAVGRFGAGENGVSLGRYETSVGIDFVALGGRSFGVDAPGSVAEFRGGRGKANGEAQVGPLVINEVMYHGTNEAAVELSEEEGEYLEVANVSGQAVALYNVKHPENTWRLGGGVAYRFPAVVVPAGGYLLAVNFDPAKEGAVLGAFRQKYGVGVGVPVYGPYEGKLSNEGEGIELLKPDAPQAAPHPDAGYVPYILVERVEYGDRLPWPERADGTGRSLQRKRALAYGNDPINWQADWPTPGRGNGPSSMEDNDGDGMPDDWEQVHGFDTGSAQDAGLDADGDGQPNLAEYLSGTDPRDAQSYLQVGSISADKNGVLIRFLAAAGKTYTIQYRDSIASGDWLRLTDINAQPVPRMIDLTNLVAPASNTRFYRLLTPSLP